MKDKTRIIVILGAVGLAGAGGLGYLLKVYLPGQQRAAAQKEITAWEERLAAARACLLGPTPASGSSDEALAVRELQPDPWDRGTCSKLIAKINRGVAEDTGLMPVEHAWMALDRAAAKVATAFATHVDPFGEKFEDRGKPSPLPEALTALDEAHAALRQAAGMPAPARASLPPLPAGELVPLAAGGARLADVDHHLPASAGGMLLFASTKDRAAYQVLLPLGAAPRLAKAPPPLIRAVPDLAWGVTAVGAELAVGPVDDTGTFGDVARLTVGNGGASVLFAAGAVAAGTVAYQAPDGLVFARVAGATVTPAPGVPFTDAATAVDVDGRVALAWSDPAGAMRGVLVKDGAPGAPVELGSGVPSDEACLTQTHAWFRTGPQFIAFDGTTATPHVLADHGLLGCSAKAALLRGVGSRFAVCAESCRTAELPEHAGHVAALVGDKVASVRVRGRVLGVWREGAPAAFFGLPDKLSPIAAQASATHLEVLGEAKDGLVVARVPLR